MTKAKHKPVETYKDRKGEWRWRVRWANGLIAADSGEGYTRRADCVDAFAGFLKRMKVLTTHPLEIDAR